MIDLEPRYQRAAVEHERGPMIVLAGPGTGKTTILTHRMARLVEKGLASPHDILAVTFTRKAAAEMRERAQLLLGQDVEGLNVSTIHSLAYRIIRATSRRASIRILDPTEAFQFLRRAALETGLTPNRWDPVMLFEEIQRAKGFLVGPDEYVRTPGSYFEEHVGRVYRRYQQLLAEEGALDLADLIFKAVRILRRDTALLAHLRNLTPFIMVDEFQDTSLGQYELIKLLAEKSRNLFVVISPAQALYEWRDAYADRLLAAMRRDFPEAKEVTLRLNYRSTGTIVQASRAIANGYPDVNLEATREAGEPIKVARLLTPDDEASFVAAEVSRLHGEEGIAWHEMAVLYRRNTQAYPVEEMLSQAGVPYTPGREQLYQREEVLQVLSYLRLALDPDDAPGALDMIVNAPPRGIGPNSLRRIKGTDTFLTMDHLAETVACGLEWGLREQVVHSAYALMELVDELHAMAKQVPPAKLISHVLEATKFEEWLQDEFDAYQRLASVHRLQQEATRFDRLEDFLDHAQERADFLGTPRGVQLNTIHSAKGLEFQVVFMIGMEEGILPHARALKKAADPPEERRLCYVGITRAKDRLYLLCTRTRPNGRDSSSSRLMTPSRYLGELPRELLVRLN